MNNPDYRALCAELVDSLENARRIIQHADGTLHINTAEFVLRRARALLAEPRIISRDRDETGPYVVVAESAGSAKPALAEPDGCDFPVCIDDDSEEGTCSRWLAGSCEGPASAARAVLARYGSPAAAPVPEPPAEGPTDEELYELWEQEGYEGDFQDCRRFYRGASARWGRPAAAPVPVSERLPGPEDCTTNPRTGQGQWCWGWVQHDPAPYSGRWRMMRREWLADEATHWLPSSALPLPAPEGGEVS